MQINLPELLFIVYCAFASIQLIYYFFYFARFAFYKEKALDVFNQAVSIIICAHNEETNVRQFLPAILNQQYEKNGSINFEVLVVNDNSTDNTQYVLETLKNQYPHLNVLNLSQESQYMKGKKFPLSMGLKQAKFDYVLLTDADCMPASNQWLQQMVNGFSEGKEIVLGVSPYLKEAGRHNQKVRYETFYTAFQYVSFALAKRAYMGVGRNLAYNRQLFFNNKGFSSHQHLLSGDDDLFINQVANAHNTTVVLNQSAFTYSKAKQDTTAWRMQKKRHLSTSHLYKPKDKLTLGLLAFSHFYMFIGLLPLVIDSFYLVLGICVFLFRWVLIWFVQMRVLEKLNENDLVHRILFFDVWMLIYYVKNIPNIFFRKKVKGWK